jgi:hypothetical protein
MPQPCDQASSATYDVNHNPWAYIGEAAQCRANDVPAGTPVAGPGSRTCGAAPCPQSA